MKVKSLFIAASLVLALFSTAGYAKDIQPIKSKHGKVVMKNGSPVHSRSKNFHKG